MPDYQKMLQELESRPPDEQQRATFRYVKERYGGDVPTFSEPENRWQTKPNWKGTITGRIPREPSLPGMPIIDRPYGPQELAVYNRLATLAAYQDQVSWGLEHIEADHKVLQAIHRLHHEQTYQVLDRRTGRYRSVPNGICDGCWSRWPCRTIKCFDETGVEPL